MSRHIVVYQPQHNKAILLYNLISRKLEGYIMDKTKIGKRIKRVRLLRNLTSKELAEMTSYTADYIRKIESGKSLPSLDCIVNICNVTNVSPEYLLADELDIDKSDNTKYNRIIQLLDKLDQKEQALAEDIIVDVIDKIEKYIY